MRWKLYFKERRDPSLQEPVKGRVEDTGKREEGLCRRSQRRAQEVNRFGSRPRSRPQAQPLYGGRRGREGRRVGAGGEN